MNVQVLVAAMNQTDHSLLEKMNIQTDAVVGNQCSVNSVEAFEWKGHAIKYLNFAERGVGLNRNNALMRANGDIVLFADDDMTYVDGYAQRIEQAFGEHPDADVIVFNISGRSPIKKTERVGYLNFLRYGTARVAARLNSIRLNGICFNQCFGGGTEHCHGEDNLFLAACLDKGLRIYAVPVLMAELKDSRASTWNRENTDQYLADQGMLYRVMSRRWWRLLCIQDAVRRAKRYKRSWTAAYKAMVQGASARRSR